MKALEEKALLGFFSVIVKHRECWLAALLVLAIGGGGPERGRGGGGRGEEPPGAGASLLRLRAAIIRLPARAQGMDTILML